MLYRTIIEYQQAMGDQFKRWTDRWPARTDAAFSEIRTAHVWLERFSIPAWQQGITVRY